VIKRQPITFGRLQGDALCRGFLLDKNGNIDELGWVAVSRTALVRDLTKMRIIEWDE
jgi:hypothetical protein